ncbi:glycoside hydrolase superfamily [Cokeromyces recurvatus]|uniref:glycoside hydrolase superfamily n=1 Tax=Cokeromyces recurvatus TaxID=90255 RepID=UPI0022207D8D|nr:glycoside hydrolase superfamily [Cokeromyces recurvatus]KAI7901692.1 glycoside hydrolase superfamily [Cokeromyces recurvatus]
MELDGRWFIDQETKCTVLFKGINLSGGTKLPVNIPSNERNGYWVDYDRKVSFIGRPFPLDEADEHLQRLVNYGFNLLRFVITWEAVEHEGPGIYDQDYLTYVIDLLKKCGQYGFKVFIDPHQDCWSRHCGGSGHPGWTLSLVGFDPLHFPQTNAAIVHNLYPEPQKLPKMIWNTNYQRLAALTMFTLFFAGKIYAPKCIVNGIHVQDYLQQHYFRCFQEVARRIHENGLENTVVIGYDTMNEPGKGYLSMFKLDELNKEDTSFKMGLMPTPFQGMLLGSGIATKVENWEFKWNGPKKVGEEVVDPGHHTTAWLTEDELKQVNETFGWERGPEWRAGCIWDTHGIWDKSSKQLLQPEYFATNPQTGNTTHYIDYWLEYLQDYTKAIREIHSDAIIFVQSPVLEEPPKIPSTLKRIAYAPHWYDGLTLVKKKWSNYNVDVINLNRGKYGTGPLRFIRALRIGEKAIRQCFVDQLKTIQTEGLENMGEYPCVLGEIGIPYDMETGVSAAIASAAAATTTTTTSDFIYSWWTWILSFFSENNDTKERSLSFIGNPKSSQNKAMDANINALEKNLLNYTIWHYVADNSPEWGDNWNGEDISIWQCSPEKGPSSYTTKDCTTHTLSSSVTITDSPDSDIIKTKSNNIDDYLDTMTNSTLDSFSGLLQQQQSEQINNRDLVCLHRPHAKLTSGTPLKIDFISPTENQRAVFNYTFHYKSSYAKVPTVIHVPIRFFPLPPDKTKVKVSNGYWKIQATFDHYWILYWIIEDEVNIEKADLLLEGITTAAA